jgi:plasmid stabilization system protein ParE
MDLTFHPQAARDAQTIARKYADISRKLVQRFWVELDSAVELLAAHPRRYHFDPSGMRRLNFKKFPYHLLFEEGLGSVRVIVIRHHHQNPSFGLRRR